MARNNKSAKRNQSIRHQYGEKKKKNDSIGNDWRRYGIKWHGVIIIGVSDGA